jgi:hypothetical protein
VTALSQGADETLLAELRGAAESAGLAEAADKAEELAGTLPRLGTRRRRAQPARRRTRGRPRDAERPPRPRPASRGLAPRRADHRRRDPGDERDPRGGRGRSAWQARFHRNLHEDSRRLADASRALASYLEAGGDTSRVVLSPQEEFHAWLDGQGYRLGWIEEGAPEAEDAARDRRNARARLGRVAGAGACHVAQYRADAAAMPEGRVRALLQAAGLIRRRFFHAFSTDYPAVFRRMLALADAAGFPSLGLAVCDGSGSMILRKSAEGFPLPLFGAACPLWPLYQALTRPHVPLRERLELPGQCRAASTATATGALRLAGRIGVPHLPPRRLPRAPRAFRDRPSRMSPQKASGAFDRLGLLGDSERKNQGRDRSWAGGSC